MGHIWLNLLLLRVSRLGHVILLLGSTSSHPSAEHIVEQTWLLSGRLVILLLLSSHVLIYKVVTALLLSWLGPTKERAHLRPDSSTTTIILLLLRLLLTEFHLLFMLIVRLLFLEVLWWLQSLATIMLTIRTLLDNFDWLLLGRPLELLIWFLLGKRLLLNLLRCLSLLESKITPVDCILIIILLLHLLLWLLLLLMLWLGVWVILVGLAFIWLLLVRLCREFPAEMFFLGLRCLIGFVLRGVIKVKVYWLLILLNLEGILLI